jgi:hypothetical protein
MIRRCVLSLSLMFPCATLQAADLDWKMFGGASVAGPSLCFYDVGTVAHASNNYVRVWTKCLALKELDGVNFDDDVGKRIVDAATSRVVAGYVPPVIAIGQMELKQLPDVVAYEEIADMSAIEPQAQIFLELNCGERMERELRTSMHVNGRSYFQDKPSEWEYVAPEGNTATLLKLLCQ